MFNCLLSNGDWLFMFCSIKLVSIICRVFFGLVCLSDVEVEIDFVVEIMLKDVVSIIVIELLMNDE